MTATLRVELGPASYDVAIGPGLLDDAPARIAAACPAAAYALITDSSVAPQYAGPLAERLGDIAPTTVMEFPAGEWNKTVDTWAELSDRMIQAGIGRDGAVVAVGGGVVGDVAGFVAATYLRGVPFVQIPTTLLAMIDSSVGGKTGVDTPQGKNLIGAFHQPRLVLADTRTLATLPRAHRAAGLAEALKHGVIADATYFAWLTEQADALLEADPDISAVCVERSVAIKAEVVAADEQERDRRATLNFGHTVAHALEAVSEFGLLHGEAVALGMVAEAHLGVDLGITEEPVPMALREACAALGLPLDPPEIPPGDGLHTAMLADKKARDREVRFALPARIGEMAREPSGSWTHAADRERIDAALALLG